MTSKSEIRPYTAYNGNTQYKPSLNLLGVMSDEQQGFCVACGEVAEGVEPDAKRYKCSSCGASKVYGPEVLIGMRLVFDSEV